MYRVLVLIAFCLVGCASQRLETKPWHTSPSSSPLSSTVYRVVPWSVVLSLHPGMMAAEAERLVFELQSYHHPVNAIIYSKYSGQNIEVALKISSDGQTVEDISYKIRGKIAEPDDAENSGQSHDLGV